MHPALYDLFIFLRFWLFAPVFWRLAHAGLPVHDLHLPSDRRSSLVCWRWPALHGSDWHVIRANMNPGLCHVDSRHRLRLFSVPHAISIYWQNASLSVDYISDCHLEDITWKNQSAYKFRLCPRLLLYMTCSLQLRTWLNWHDYWWSFVDCVHCTVVAQRFQRHLLSLRPG